MAHIGNLAIVWSLQYGQGTILSEAFPVMGVEFYMLEEALDQDKCKFGAAMAVFGAEINMPLRGENVTDAIQGGYCWIQWKIYGTSSNEKEWL